MVIAANSFFTETIKRKKEPEKLKKLMTKATYSLRCSFWATNKAICVQDCMQKFFFPYNK